MTTRLFALALFSAALLSAQSIPLFNVSTGLTCTAAVAAPSVTLDCSYRGNGVMASTIALASLLGNGNGFTLSLFTGDTVKEQLTVLLRRQKIADPLHIEVAVNGSISLTKDVVIP